MRKFGKDTPEFLTFTVGDGEKVYKLPLAASMPFETALRFAEIAAISDSDLSNLEAMKLQLDMLREHMGEDANKLTAGQVSEIFNAWTEASNGETGASTGE